MLITNKEEWPIMPESFISAERKRQRRVRNITKIEEDPAIQILSPPPGEESTVLSPSHLTEEEETTPLADLAVKIKRSSRRHSQSSQKQKKAEDSRVKRKPAEMPALKTEEEVSKKQEVPSSSIKDKKKGEDGEMKIAKRKKEHSVRKHALQEPEVVSEPKVEEQQQRHGVTEEKMEVDGQEGTFQPRSLRLRLSRQDDGNLTVVDENPTSLTQPQSAPKSPIKLRLSLSPTKPPEPPITSMAIEALVAAFPNVNLDTYDEIHPPLKKKSRTSTSIPTEKELLHTAMSILRSAEAKAKKAAGKSASPKNTKRYFVHRVLKELTKRVLNEACTSDTIPANLAQEVYNQLEPVLTNWVSVCAQYDSDSSA
ncbi:unnamed protein product [Rodentolepis nana]|uniref:EOG090X0GP9 n=1 Tax=Rodentolepis nana TaxID=102285 RepID=A0A0R3THU4_RODNA|nr:unnamed protein product [Rodentolepis nana]